MADTSEATGKAKQRILIVEDEPSNVYATKFILEWHGFEVITAKNGHEGIERARDGKPDLIIMDMMMPGLSGYETTRLIRQEAAISGIPIIALTARAMRDDREKTLQAGCNDYIAKPIEDMDHLIQTVKNWIGRDVSSPAGTSS